MIGGIAAAALLLAAAAAPPAEDLQRHRNLGKAFYENPTTQYEAVAELQKALALVPDSARDRVNYGLALLRAGQDEKGIAELLKAQAEDPKIPHTWFNVGMAYKQQSRYDEARAQLEQMVALVPDNPIAHYNLGVLYKLDRRMEDAVREWRRAIELEPNLSGVHFQLATAYKQAQRPEDAAREMAAYNEIKKRTAGAAVKEDLEWSAYSELYDVVEAPAAEGETDPAPLRLTPTVLQTGLDPAAAGVRVLDLGVKPVPALLAWSSRGIVLYENGRKKTSRGLSGVRGVVGVEVGDFDNDGLADLVVLTGRGAALWRQEGSRFRPLATTLPSGSFRAALWVDYDHDYDLDLLLLGKTSKLLRNEGAQGFADATADIPWAQGEALAAVSIDTVSDNQARDLVVTYADHPGVVYHDRLGGRFEAVSLPAVPGGARDLVAHDADADGWTDLAIGDGGRTRVLINDRKGSFRSGADIAAAGPLLFADLENRGRSALVVGGRAYAELGREVEPSGTELPGWPPALVAVTAGHFGAGGETDIVGVDDKGALRLLTPSSSPARRWLAVGLEGTRNLKLAAGATVEIRAGRLYQKKNYRGTPLVFGLGGYDLVDTVRITWPNGLIQNETRQAAGSVYRYKEAQRLSGSCPTIYTWNGSTFEFITDVLGVAPLGASAGNGQYFPVDHDEVVQIPGESLKARDGVYEIRVVEELGEVTYLDEAHLVAVDRPASVEIFTNDKFKSPPFPEFRLFGVERRIPPIAALDESGRDVRDRLRARDAVYVDTFRRDRAGVAATHHLDLDFGKAAPAGRAILVLSGWVDWPDGSTFLGRAQESVVGLAMPSVQVKDANGRWQTVIEDMGMPAGKPKTIVVDLSGKFLSASREVRITTNLCVYWDEAFLAEDAAEPGVRRTELPVQRADLGLHGFSRVILDPERRQPERFVYASIEAAAMWNPTPGLYTRYGDVVPLLTAIDDRLLILGAGDEVRLRFDASALPPVAPGFRRDFLFSVDGWAKDRDANTAYAHSVEPLPYHGMKQYPYVTPDRFPDDPEHEAYRREYNTRPALRFIRPLTEGLVAAGEIQP